MANILIVDDIAQIRKNISRVLIKEGHKINEACNGVEALNIIKNGDIDLIILDIMMPEKGGLETLIELSEFKKVKKILITGINVPQSDAFSRFMVHFGAKSLLQKPFKKTELLEAVNNALK
jgi:two-component system response regulator VanR